MDLSVFSIISNAGIIVKSVMLLLIVMSIYSWTIIFTKWIQLSVAHRKALQSLSLFENAKDLREAVHQLGYDDKSTLYKVAQHGVLEFNRSKEANVSVEIVVDNVRRSLHQGVNSETNRFNSSLSTLATCANAAPFIGLFGTVWGIMTSFNAIGLMKSASLATVAPGISEALIATAIGLFVAVPATIFFNHFLGKITSIENLLINFAGSFLNRVQRDLNRQV